MEMKIIDTVNMPTWALCSIYNGDNSGTTEEEDIMVESWERELLEYIQGEGYKHYSLDFDSGMETSFVNDPLFGLAADCVQVDIVAFK